MPQDAAKKPNIIFICTDYQAGEDGPSLGSPFLDMPALDRLSKNGVIFDRHYSTAPICMPERATWVTGQYPHTHGQWGNGGEMPKTGNGPTLMEELGRNGYYTLGIGKMHFNPWDLLVGFDRRIIADRKANIEWDARHDDDYAKHLAMHSLTRWDYLKLAYESEMPHVYDWPYPEECHIDHFVGARAQQAIRDNELPADKPWFMWVSFNGPHNPWDPPKKYSDPYMAMDLPAPRDRANLLDMLPVSHTSARYDYTKEVADYVDRYPERAEAYIKRLRANHYGNLTLIDRQVEGLLDLLDQRGELDDTIVIWSADHGAMLGDQGHFHKGFIHERSARVPFVAHCPARFNSRRTQALCGGVDLMPTLLDLAGAPVPERCEGRSFASILTGESETVQDAVFIEIAGRIGVVTEEWKYFKLADGGTELYNIKKDPNEFSNRAEAPEFSGVRREMEARLVALRPEFADKIAKQSAEPFVFASEFCFAQGDVREPRKTPYPPDQGGRAVYLRVVLNGGEEQPPDGVIFATEEMIGSWPWMPPQNGYALYAKDGHARVGIRHWHADCDFEAIKALPKGRVVLELLLGVDGAVELNMNGKTVVAGNAGGPALPIRRGRREIVAPYVHVGAGHEWGPPLGDYDQTADYQGIIEEAYLRLG